MFRGKESSNRIKISRLVQDLLNFGVFGSLWLWGGGRWWGVSVGIWGVGWGVSPHTCTCMCMHIHAHKCMYRNCKWPPTWRHPCLSCLSCLTCMCMHVCMHVHVLACIGHPPHTNTYPHPIHPSATPQGGPAIS